MSPLKNDPDLETRPYRSISEVAELVGVKPHVLRYWESQFGMLRPRKNRAGNRMYRPEEVRLLLQIKELLYDRRFTIEGAKRRLLDERRGAAPQAELPLEKADSRVLLHDVKTELRRLLGRLRGHEESARP